MATHSSILYCRIPWTEEPRGLQSKGSQRVGHDCNDLACMHACINKYIRELVEEKIYMLMLVMYIPLLPSLGR